MIIEKQIYLSPFERLKWLAQEICSQCSQCSQCFGGIWGYLKQNLIFFIDNYRGEPIEVSSPQELLELIDHERPLEERKQFWDPAEAELWLACGDGRNCVFVSSKKRLKPSRTAYETKLTPDVVKRFLDGAPLIDGKKLLSKVIAVLEKHVWYPDKRFYVFRAVYHMATYCYSIFNYFGYHFAFSQKPRSGKTREQEVGSHLSYEATDPINCPTPASLRDTAASGGTVQLDTVERWRDKDSYMAVMELLDAGFRKGGTVMKSVYSKRRNDWETQRFPIYAPYALAGIRKESLTDTAIDRSFTNEMQRKPRRVRKKYHPPACEKVCKPLRDEMYLWALQFASLVSGFYQSACIEQAVEKMGLNDRAADIWRPLFTVLHALGHFDSEDYKTMTALAKEMHGDREEQEIAREISILHKLIKKAGKNDRVVGTTTELMDDLRSQGVEIDKRGFRDYMKLWGFEQRSLRVGDSNEPRRVWALPLSKLIILERQLRGDAYIPPER